MNTEKITRKLCYPEQVYNRISKKLNLLLSNSVIKACSIKILQNTEKECLAKRSEDYYVTNKENKVRLTLNANTYRVIADDRLVRTTPFGIEQWIYGSQHQKKTESGASQLQWNTARA